MAVLPGSQYMRAQLIYTEPAFVTDAGQPVSIYFDASRGNMGLKGYEGDVYAHTGVLTTRSQSTANWKYVKTSWGQNSSFTKMTRLSGDIYRLDITPSIQEYYGFSDADTITDLAFVFRSGVPENNGEYYQGKAEGNQDIFIPLTEPGINLRVLLPEVAGQIVELNDSIHFRAIASSADSMAIFINGVHKSSTTSDHIRYDAFANEFSDQFIMVKAYGKNEVRQDSANFHVRRPILTAELPEGLRDGINYTSDTSVTLVLFAPYKKHVFLIGDLSSWFPGISGYMKQTTDKTRYWIEVGGLTPGKEYRYQYLVNGELRIADYYTGKILDEANDPNIPESVYPDLIEYPSGLTHDLVSVLQPGGKEYTWRTTDFKKPGKTRLVIYELLIRDFIARHDFRTLTDTLDYLDRLGINAIGLMPFNEFEGNSSWGYNPSFYFAVDKYYGPSDDLKAFIDSCHSRGIAVIMDLVLNHTYGQNPMVRLYYNEVTGRVTGISPWFNVDSPNPVYSWGFDFNHESPYTKAFVDRVTRFWLKEYKIDGFRFDFTKGFTNTPGEGTPYDPSRIAILKRMADSIRAFDPETYIILEHFAENKEEKELARNQFLLWGNLNEEYAEATMGYPSNLSWGVYSSRDWSNPNLVTYMESHDEERIMYKTKTFGASSGDYNTRDFDTRLERMALSSVFLLGLPGPKMIWQFGEIGYSINIDYQGRTGEKPILWELTEDRRRLRLFLIISELNRLRNEYNVFHTFDFEYNLSSSSKRINLNHPDLNVTIIGNFATSEAVISPEFQSPGTWYDYFTGQDLEVTNVNDLITLRPGEWHLYTDRQLDGPDIISSVEEITGTANYYVYPNPSREGFYFRVPVGHTLEIEIFDITGRMIWDYRTDRMQRSDESPAGQSIFPDDLKSGSVVYWNGRTSEGTKTGPGIYIARVIMNGSGSSLRLVIE